MGENDKMKLSVFDCKNAKPRNLPYKLNDGGGLYLHVMPNGSRHWRLRYRIHGKENRISLGMFPDVSLAEARDKRHEEKKLIQNGLDPSLARQEKKRLAKYQSGQTF